MRRDLTRQDRGSSGDLRWSALWGKPSRGETRSSALWGKGGRGFLATLVVAVGLAAPVAYADSGSGSPSFKAYTTPGLVEDAQATPRATFDVILVGADRPSGWLAKQIANFDSTKAKVRKQYRSINGVAARLTGSQILALARNGHVDSITYDSPVVLAGGLSNKQRWPFVSGVQQFWAGGSSAATPTIAVVDSGIDAGRADFGGRVVAQVNMTSLPGNSAGDGRGHGTFVAGIAAGSGDGYAGAAPASKIVSLDVMDENGMAMTRVVVVTAVGNYGVAGQASGVPFAPGNDPFVITVGADDVDGSVSTNDDYAAPWSAYGYTLDGFAKPDVAAPGRYMVGPAPATSTLSLERPASIVAPGYIQLSGTSFAAPIVAGAAAQILGTHPTWTPDQVKGALMVSARPAGDAAPLSTGVGIVDVAKAVALGSAPDANAALRPFVKADPAGGTNLAFDAASWANTAIANASWANASWANASWSNASWSNASWASASWCDASWSDASWAQASWASVSYADNAEGDVTEAGGEWIDPAELEALLFGDFPVASEPATSTEPAAPPPDPSALTAP